MNNNQNFFSQELKRIVPSKYPNVAYFPTACYVPLSGELRAKISFISSTIHNQYDTILLTILNRTQGEVDRLCLKFHDLLGTKMVSNPNFPYGVAPHIWVDQGNPKWYVYRPTSEDYHLLMNAVDQYLQQFVDTPVHTECSHDDKMYRLGEVVFDITTCASEFLRTLDDHTEHDSRELYFQIFTWAKEYEQSFDEQKDDYLATVDAFAYKKLQSYFSE